MDIITINGVTLPAPSSLNIQLSDLDSPDSVRNELGFLQRDRIREEIYKISLAFKVKTSSELYTIQNAIKPSSVSVTFPTPSGMITKTMYVGDRTMDIVLYNGGQNTRWDMSFNLIEY